MHQILLKRFTFLLMGMTCLLCLFERIHADEEKELSELKPVQKLIEQLGDDRLAIRTQASKALMTLKTEHPLLKEALESASPRIQTQIKHILQYIKIAQRYPLSEVVPLSDKERIYHLLSQRNATDIWNTYFHIIKQVQLTEDDMHTMTHILIKAGIPQYSDRKKMSLLHMMHTMKNNKLVLLPNKHITAGMASVFLNDKAPMIRNIAIAHISVFGDETYANNIAPLLHDPFTYIRNSAIRALAQIHAVKYTDHIAQLMDDATSSVRSSSIRALGALNAKKYIDRIALFLDDTSSDSRIASVQALARLNATQYAKKIANLLKEEKENIRIAAIWALADLESQEYTQEIVRCIKTNQNVSEVIAAGVALIELGEKKQVTVSAISHIKSYLANHGTSMDQKLIDRITKAIMMFEEK